MPHSLSPHTSPDSTPALNNDSPAAPEITAPAKSISVESTVVDSTVVETTVTEQKTESEVVPSPDTIEAVPSTTAPVEAHLPTTSTVVTHVSPHRTKKRWPLPVASVALGVGLTAVYLNSQRPTTVVTSNSSNRIVRATSTPAPRASNKNAPTLGATPFRLPGFLQPAPIAKNSTKGNATQQPVASARLSTLSEKERARIAAEFQTAVTAQRAGRTKEALTAYRRVLALKTDIPEARINLALLLLKDKRPQAALVELRRARELDRRNPAVAMQMAETLLSLKRSREAVDPLKSVVALVPENPQGWATLAQTQAALNRPAEATAAWKRVAALLPNDVRAPLALASIAGRSKDLAQAESWARRALKISDKRDPRATLLLGRVLATRGKTREAESLLRDGMQRFPNVLEMGTVLSDVRWARGDKKAAISTLQSLLPRVPASQDKGIPRAQLYSQIGRALAETGRHREAAEALSNASTLVPENAGLRALWGEALLRTGDRSGGIQQLRRALSIDAKRVELRWPLARALASGKDWKLADVEYSKARQASKIAPEMLAGHAQVQEQLNQTGSAIATWKKLSQLVPKSPLPLLQSGRLLHNSGRSREALNAYTNALQLNAKEPNALLGAARLEEEIGDSSRALSQWTRLAQARPNFTPAYGRAMLLAVKQQKTVATASALKAPLNLQPKNRQAFAAVLRGLLDAGEITAAQRYIKDFRRRFPDADAPKWAQAALDVELKKRQLAAAQQRTRAADNGKGAEAKPRPATAPTSATSTRPSQSRTTPRATPRATPNPTPRESPRITPTGPDSLEVVPSDTTDNTTSDLTFTPSPLPSSTPRPQWTPRPLSAPAPSTAPVSSGSEIALTKDLISNTLVVEPGSVTN